MTIRQATKADTDTLARLFQTTLRHTFTQRDPETFKLEDYEKSVAEEEVWVAEENGAIVGFVSIFKLENFVHNLFVHPDCQKRGIGKQLLKKAESRLFYPMTLKIAHDNTKVCAFYEKQGWQKLSTQTDALESYMKYGKLEANSGRPFNCKMIIVASSAEDQQLIDDKIVAFNRGKVPFTQDETIISMNYVIKDEQEKIMAGINALMYCWKILYVDVLFVDEEYRHREFGSQLLKKVETEAKLHGATLVHLDTFAWQAKDFYIKMGYQVFGVLDDCPPGHKRYYMQKIL